MDRVEVRRAVAADLDAARHVIIFTWLETYIPIHGEDKVRDIISRWHTPQNISAQINDEAALFGVALIGGKIKGHVYATDHDGDLKINRLYVLPEAQGEGVGQRLFDFTLDSFPNAKSLSLEVDEQNPKAIRFYEQNGMKITGETESCGSDSDISALIMTKSLERPTRNEAGQQDEAE